MKDESTKVKAKAGMSHAMTPQSPAIFLVGKGRSAYLWIGNGAEDDKWCFATVHGQATLRRLALSILATTDKPNKRRK